MPPLPSWAHALAVALALAVLLPLERRRPLRPAAEGKSRRVLRNLATGGLGFLLAWPLQATFLVGVGRAVETRGIGLLNALALAPWLEVGLAVVLLDYTLWHWHWLNHQVPFFWRFHLVHHVDRELDASTGLRFHFGELGLSVFYRSLQVAVIGPSPFAVSLWQLLLFVSVLFHHSNVRLPHGVERLLVRLLVTPRMHGIHHSTVPEETNSNYASLLVLWDRLHRTLRLNVPSREVAIGVPAYRQPSQVTFARLQHLPFRRLPPIWVDETGARPRRPETGAPRHRLLA